jgi:hypothetical protein
LPTTCLYCPQPLPPHKRVLCGSAECLRARNREYARREYARRRAFLDQLPLAAPGQCPVCSGPVLRRSTVGRAPVYCSAECLGRKGRDHARIAARARARRAAERATRPTRRCLQCDGEFRPTNVNCVRCSARCTNDYRNALARARTAAARRVESRACAGCEKTFTPLPNNAGKQRYCGIRCQLNAHKLRYRARLAEATIEEFRLVDVFERDGWTCQICMEPIDPALKAPNQWARSIDHRVPLSRGGPHSFDNCQAAHLWCNSVKKERDFSFAS